MANLPIHGALAEADSRIGTNVPNCRVLVANIRQRDETLTVIFDALYFWNAAALQAWRADRSVQPFWRETLTVVDDQGADSPRALAYAYLLTQPRFAGWTQG